MKNKKKIIIIGGGLGGISTAIRLAKNNFDITIIEKNSNLGGKMNVLEKDGFKFDTGPSLITLPKVFEELYESLEEDLHDHIELIKVNPLFKYMFDPGEELLYSSNLSDLEKLFNDNEELGNEKFYNFITKSSKLFRLSEKTFFKKELLSTPNFTDLILFFKSPFKLFFQNYEKLIEKTFKNEKIRKIFNRYPTYVGSSPYKSSSILSIIPFMELSFGAWYIKGGLYKLIESLENLLISNNIEIKKNKKVASIDQENGIIKSVTLSDGEKILTDIIVSNVDPLITKSMLDKKYEVSNENLSMSGLVFLVGINKKIPELLHHNVIFSDNYKKEFEEIFDYGQFPSDPTVYINCPTKTDFSLAPNNSESIFLMCNSPATKEIWDENSIKESLEKVRMSLAKHKLEKIIDEAKFIESITPNDIEKKFAAPFGSIYGKVSHGIKGTVFRHPNKDKNIKGLYYVGGGVHPGGGTPTVIMSGNIVSKKILEDYEK